ncbi:MAG: hypothetical protein GC150_05465 [Rhizobiales bacterium]|nr:hypothetical protein [Hyphomicrobiales bacterium]
MVASDLKWAGLTQQMSPMMTVLTPDQRRVLINAAFEICEVVGNRVGSKEALELFRKAGCRIEPLDDEGCKVFIPQRVIEQALRDAPRRLTIYDRNGEPTLFLQGRNSYFAPTAATPHMYDPLTGERRPWTKADIGKAALVTDALPNLDFMFTLGSLAEDYGKDCFVHEFEAMVANTTKPIMYLASDAKDLEAICEIAAVACSGWDNLRQRPYIMHLDDALSPLKHKNSSFDKMLYLAGQGLPVRYGAFTMAGASSPITLPGATAICLAESFVALAACQLKNPGSPYIMSILPAIIDMKLGIMLSGTPEYHRFGAMYTEIVHDLGLPVMSTAGITDAKVIDAQAGAETLWSFLTAAMTGCHLNLGAGSLESHLIGSFEHLVLSDECVSAVRHFMRNSAITEETLALDVIREVGAGLPNLIFLDREHTNRHYMAEQWKPRVFSRQNYTNWSANGKPWTHETCNKVVREILENHKPEPLSEEILARIAEISEGATNADTLAVAKTAKATRRRKFRAG